MQDEMEARAKKIVSTDSSKVAMKIIPGHFATNHSHINYYIDMTTMKSRQSSAHEVARAIVGKYQTTKTVDTIVCMDDTETIGAYLADELTSAGFLSMNAHKSIYVITPEFNSVGQLIFRDNLQPMVRDKHMLLLLASATTGRTIERALECIDYYGGIVEDIIALFSATDNVSGYDIRAVFKDDDIPGYATYPHNACPYCKDGVKIDAIVNSFGYSKL